MKRSAMSLAIMGHGEVILCMQKNDVDIYGMPLASAWVSSNWYFVSSRHLALRLSEELVGLVEVAIMRSIDSHERRGLGVAGMQNNLQRILILGFVHLYSLSVGEPYSCSSTKSVPQS